MKKVCICIPLYNAESSIEQTLESLVSQDFTNLIIKVFDNVSSDRGPEIVLDYKNRFPFIELFRNESNLGAEGNFTKCLQAAEGDYTLIAHSDDIYLPNFLSTAVKYLENNSDVVATFCDAIEIDGIGNTIGKRFWPNELNNPSVTYLNRFDLLNLFFKYSNFITCPSVVTHSKLYRDSIQTWDGTKYNTSADLDVWIRLSMLGKFAAISSPLIKYRVADISYSFRVAQKRITRHDFFKVLDEHITDGFMDDYYFLSMKDQSLRSLNILRNKMYKEHFPQDFKLRPILIIKKMSYSKWHFKFGTAIFAISALVLIIKLLGWNKWQK